MEIAGRICSAQSICPGPPFTYRTLLRASVLSTSTVLTVELRQQSHSTHASRAKNALYVVGRTAQSQFALRDRARLCSIHDARLTMATSCFARVRSARACAQSLCVFANTTQTLQQRKVLRTMHRGTIFFCAQIKCSESLNQFLTRVCTARSFVWRPSAHDRTELRILMIGLGISVLWSFRQRLRRQ